MPHFQVPPAKRKNAQRMRRTMTVAEAKFWNAACAHRLAGLSFRRQMPIGDYIVDFACPDHRLIVEIDGPSHSFDTGIARDRVRDAVLKSYGWQPLHFTNEDALQRLEEVCTHILRTVGIHGF